MEVALACSCISIEKKVANDKNRIFPPLFLNKKDRETRQYGYVLHWLGLWDTFPNCDTTFGFWHRTLDCVWVPVALYPRLLSHLNVSDQRESKEFKRSHDKKGSWCAEKTISVKLPLPNHIVVACQLTKRCTWLSIKNKTCPEANAVKIRALISKSRFLNLSIIYLITNWREERTAFHVSVTS